MEVLLYFFYQTGDFFVCYRFLFSFVINGKESDNSFFYADYRSVGNHPCAMTFAFTFVADRHAHFVDTVAKVGSLGGVLS